MMAGAATLLPVRMETRFDRLADGQLRLRIIVVPDRCWFDRQNGATDTELDLLAQTVDAAQGSLLPGQVVDEGAGVADAFRGFAAQVGPARAAWLAAAFPPSAQAGGRWSIDRSAGERASGARPTRITGLPARLELWAVRTDGAHALVATTEVPPTLSITADDDEPDAWWPRWDELLRVGLAVDLLPSPVEPDQVEALFAIGVGEHPSADVFARHAACGDLGALAVGRPTNTVSGEPTADVDRDADTWRNLAGRSPTPDESRVSLALTGQRDKLGPLVGPHEPDGDAICRALIASLFPALAAYGLREVWGATRDTVGELCDWAYDLVRPDGPVPPVRIGDQPYAVWPVSAWAEWDASDGPPIEPRIVSAALGARAGLAASVSQRLGTVTGADAHRLWELLAQTPTSSNYDVRLGVGFGLFQRMVNFDPSAEEWRRQLDDSIAAAVGIPPHDPIVALGAPWESDLGVVLPPPDNVDTPHEPLFTLPRPPDDGHDPDELVTSSEWIAQASDWFLELFADDRVNPDLVNDIIERLDWWPASLWWRVTLVSGLVALDQALREEGADPDGPLPDGSAELFSRAQAGPLGGGGGPADRSYRQYRDALAELANLCRTDAGSGGALAQLLSRCLRGLLDTASHRVDPWLTGAAWRRVVDFDGRDRPVGLYGWVDGPFLGEPGPDLDVGLLLAPSVGQARLSAVLRDKSRRDPERRWDVNITSAKVRDALRLADDVRAGAHPAEAVGREVERLIGDRALVDAVRVEFPVRDEHAGRRTCDGLAVLDAARDPGDVRLTTLGVSNEVVTSIAALDTAIDAHGDLLVVEAVHHALDGRPEAAAHALDAAAGLNVPPDLVALATPSRGRSVRTTVATVVPTVASPHDGDAAQGSPVSVASPAVAAWLADIAGSPDGPGWTWSVGDVDVTLSTLGLVPADALTVSDLCTVVRLAVGALAGAPVTEPPGPALVRRAVTAIGDRPPTASELGLTGKAATAFDRQARRQLLRLLAATRQAARRLGAQLRESTTDQARVPALVQAARWALTPALADADGRVDLAASVRAARQELAARLRAVKGAPAQSTDQILTSLTSLVGGSIPITVDRTGSPVALTAEPLSEPDGRSRLDRTWLETAASVRPALARLEARQHEAIVEGRAPLVAATSHPGTPWLSAPPPEDHRVPHLIVAYGPNPAAMTSDGAWSVLDTFAETVPTPDRTAGMAMRFNAPGAQAPNAILVAVAPKPEGELTTEAALAAVEQARATAQARMARPEDLGPRDSLSGPWLPGLEDGGLQFTSRADREYWR